MRGFAGKRAVWAASVGVAMVACGLLGASNGASARQAEPPPIESATYLVGKTYFGANRYVQYIPGNSPVILTAPHGGNLRPDSIPDRSKASCGGEAVLLTDTNTAELVLAMREAYFRRFGTYPHVIINRLARSKFDANRPLDEAACGNAEAARAFAEWHAFVDVAKAEVVKTSGRGWFMDIHGHGHEIQRLELGYLIRPSDLNASDAELDGKAALAERVSIRALLREPGATLSRMLRGPSSIGPCTPAPASRRSRPTRTRSPVRPATSRGATTPAATPAAARPRRWAARPATGSAAFRSRPTSRAYVTRRRAGSASARRPHRCWRSTCWPIWACGCRRTPFPRRHSPGKENPASREAGSISRGPGARRA